jgi:hypothetical protein
MVSEADPKSWLNGQAFPAWHAPWRKNLQGTCEVSAVCVSSDRARRTPKSEESGYILQLRAVEKPSRRGGVVASDWVTHTRRTSRTFESGPSSWASAGRTGAAAAGDVEAAAAAVAELRHRDG